MIAKVDVKAGKDGMNVLGEIVEAREGQDIELAGGENTYVTTDNRFLKILDQWSCGEIE